jgi:hypothetical protein
MQRAKANQGLTVTKPPDLCTAYNSALWFSDLGTSIKPAASGRCQFHRNLNNLGGIRSRSVVSLALSGIYFDNDRKMCGRNLHANYVVVHVWHHVLNNFLKDKVQSDMDLHRNIRALLAQVM